jgi:hypothetical protein
MQVTEEHRQVDAPPPLPGVQVEWQVVALISRLARGIALAALITVGEPDEPRQFHDPLQQLQDSSRREVHSGQQADVQVAPAHQPGDVAADHQHRTNVAEQRAEVQIRKHLGGFGLQRRLACEQFLVTCRGQRGTIPSHGIGRHVDAGDGSYHVRRPVSW